MKGGIFIGKIYIEPYAFLCKELSCSYKEHFKIAKKIERTTKCNNIYYFRKSATDGKPITYLSVECLLWYVEVDLKKGNPKDKKINFLERYIERLETHLKIPHEQMEYCDLPLRVLRSYFNKTKNAIGVATNRMQKHFPYPLKYTKYGKVYVSAIGVKWLNEKYFRDKYIYYLETYKDSLESRIPN